VAAEELATTTNRMPETIGAKYGDTVVVRYTDGDGRETVARSFTVSKGSDGTIQSFSKRFKDADIAVQTQFSVAEAYFELAKNHRSLKQEELSRREIAQGRKLLEEAIRDFPMSDAKAQAEYLMAELSLELGQAEKEKARKDLLFGDALNRFTDVARNYPETPYAPKSQFKRGLVLERLGKIDEACEEYVRLAYKFPDNELIAETIARLGNYFLTKGKNIEEERKNATDIVQKEKLRLQAVDMFKTAAQVFGRLASRFPQHKLAAKTTVLAGQCYMRAEDFDQAVVAFVTVADNKEATIEPDLKAEAMYWCGDSYTKTKNLTQAYRMFKRLTWEYPETQWAKYARGRLTENQFQKEESASKE
jgi:TolA-binding protein